MKGAKWTKGRIWPWFGLSLALHGYALSLLGPASLQPPGHSKTDPVLSVSLAVSPEGAAKQPVPPESEPASRKARNVPETVEKSARKPNPGTEQRAPARVAEASEQPPHPPQTSANRRPDPADNADGGTSQEDKPDKISSELVSLLHRAIDRHKRYPLAARRRGDEGTAQVYFRLNPDGRLDQVTLRRTSGSHRLDRAAMAAVEAASPITPAGEFIEDATTIEVAIVFRRY